VSFTGSESSSTTIESEQMSNTVSNQTSTTSNESSKTDELPPNPKTGAVLPVLEISQYETLTKTNVPRKSDANNDSMDSFGTANLTGSFVCIIL